MKNLLFLIAESLLFIVFLLVLLGNSDVISVTNILNNDVYQINYLYIVAAVWVMGLLSAVLIFLTFTGLQESQKISAYKKQYEKNSIESDEKDNTVKALENKVKTLEAALNSLLENKDK